MAIVYSNPELTDDFLSIVTIKNCWKRFNKFEQNNNKNKEIIFIPLKNNPNDFPLDLRKSHILHNNSEVVDNCLNIIFPKESKQNNIETDKVVTQPTTKEEKEPIKEKEFTRTTETVESIKSDSIKVKTTEFISRGQGYGNIQTNSEALIKIADNLNKYNQTQVNILNQCLSDLSYISYEWNDYNFEKIINEISVITHQYEANFSDFDQFAKWLNSKAEIIERQKNIRK